MLGEVASADRFAALEGVFDPVSCRRLWCAVVVEHFRVVCAPVAKDEPFAAVHAHRWFEGGSFDLVCDLAGLNPSVILSEYRRLMTLDLDGRLARYRSLFGKEYRDA